MWVCMWYWQGQIFYEYFVGLCF
uniref:Uncharacterized protein n=1 Tax=Rhizophora mucronata TaxID=61149 RepID=A0A2P2NBB1_RHIMU